MNAEQLIKELGLTLGAPLELSPIGTCRVSFDSDVIEFEKMDDGHMLIMADIGSSQNREDASSVLLAANCLGLQTGGATIALDEERAVFTLHMEVWGEMPYITFENRLTLFVKALRWGQDWLSLPPLKQVVGSAKMLGGGAAQPVYGEADGIAQDVYAPLGSMLRV